MKQSTQTMVHISVDGQRLRVLRGEEVLHEFSISTSRYGLGFKRGSFKTPPGVFRIAEMIGRGAPVGTVFKSRRPVPTAEIHSPEEDLIMSRILWLDGLGVRNANSYKRFIYIHGTNHEDRIGEPASHGCVRMRNADVVTLFDLVSVGTLVTIARRAPEFVENRHGRKALRPRT